MLYVLKLLTLYCLKLLREMIKVASPISLMSLTNLFLFQGREWRWVGSQPHRLGVLLRRVLHLLSDGGHRSGLPMLVQENLTGGASHLTAGRCQVRTTLQCISA